MRLDEILPDQLKKDLTPAERRLLECIASGKEADFSAPHESQNDPTQGADWRLERTIRAALLSWLCTNQRAAACVPPKGIRIRGARIEGPLDLEGATLLHRLSLSRCAIPEGILLTDAQARRIDLSGSYTQGLHAGGLATEGDLVLSGLICTGEVRLLGAHIRGRLFCTGTRLENPNGNALSADGMTVEGSVFLRRGFHATGEVRLLGAHIRGRLSCRGTRLENPNGDALNADGMTVEGDVFLDRGFHATGEVRLRGAHIRGRLFCTGAQLENPSGDALSADGMTVEGDVFLDRGFHATGEVRLRGAHIRGRLSCRGAQLENPSGNALSADGMTVEGDVFLDRGFHATGEVRLLGSHIKGGLSCHNARFENPNGIALNLQYSRLRVIVDDEDSWPQQGRLLLDGLEYEGFAGYRTPMDARRRLEWLRRQLPDFRPQPYDQLARVFRRMGWEEEALKVLIAKQKDLIRYGKLSRWGKLTRRILGGTIGYGYRSGLALVWSLGFVIIGCLFFELAYIFGLMVPSSLEIPTDSLHSAGYPRFQALAYSLDAFLPIVDLHQENFWLPDAGKPFGALIRLYLWLHIVAGWVFSTLFVSGVTGLVKSRLE
jgi:hypothetical protein